jgi:hypothetical protein
VYAFMTEDYWTSLSISEVKLVNFIDLNSFEKSKTHRLESGWRDAATDWRAANWAAFDMRRLRLFDRRKRVELTAECVVLTNNLDLFVGP